MYAPIIFNYWDVNVRFSLVGYAQSNGRAVLVVKAGKIIFYDNTALDGSLNTDRATHAILQYRNTFSRYWYGTVPSQTLLHR